METTLAHSDVNTTTDKRMPAEEGVWMFVMGDMSVFGLFFAVFAYYFSLNPDMYLESQALLNNHYGAFNTVLLLTSSWFVVIALNAARRNLFQVAGRFVMLAFACGLGFALVKFFEYGEKINGGITLLTNEFFMFYFIYTGVHFLHLIIGMAFLMFFWFKTRSPAVSQADMTTFESVAVYWHMVDLLWIVLFPLLYMIR